VAYLLVGLSTGMILGLPGYALNEKVIYASVLVAAMYLIDHPRLFGTKELRRVTVSLDGTHVANVALKLRVEEILGIPVDEVIVKSVTSNPPVTKLDVRFRENVK
jgi:hypothetical protein